jgi:6,7-dimethyl-8-ribityllumazine synthase
MASREGIRIIEGNVVTNATVRIGIVASRFNDFIVSHLVDGAIDAFVRHGGLPSQITLVKVPGAWEIPLMVQKLASSGSVDAIVALGAVIRGSTPHFEYVASEVSKGVAQVSWTTGIPVAFGVLTTDTIEHAVERSGTKAGNKGWDAMMTAIEMVSLDEAMKPSKPNTIASPAKSGKKR